MEFVKSPIKPGSNTTIRVTGDPGSVCSIGVVDKSIELLKADHQLTPEKVLFCYNYSLLEILTNVIFRPEKCTFEQFLQQLAFLLFISKLNINL